MKESGALARGGPVPIRSSQEGLSGFEHANEEELWQLQGSRSNFQGYPIEKLAPQPPTLQGYLAH